MSILTRSLSFIGFKPHCFTLNACFRVLLVSSSLFLVACGHKNDHYQGYIEGENIYLTSSISGKLDAIYVSRGEQVKAGELLFKLDQKPQVFKLQASKAALDKSIQRLRDLKLPKRKYERDAIYYQIKQVDAQLMLDKLRVKRNRILYDKHVIAKDTLDASVAREEQHMYHKDEFEARLKIAKYPSRFEQILAQESQKKIQMFEMLSAAWELKQKSVYAPFDGIIFDTYMRVGEFVDSQHPVVALLTPENTRIEFFVPVKALPYVFVGKKIEFQCDGCKDRASAKISYISPRAEFIPPLVYSRSNADKLVFRIKASVDNPDKLTPGLPVMVTISRDKE